MHTRRICLSAALELSKLVLICCSCAPVTLVLILKVTLRSSMDSFGLLFMEPLPERHLPAVGHVYVKHYRGFQARPTGDRYVLTAGGTTWQEFERELDRLHQELDEIGREAQLRFADSTGKRYGAHPRIFRLLRGTR